ncbi:MAG: DEAD/DEAH box helicase [Lachnospiraceae bacterium]|nr:DEAD/DEAH box helicase [Lachnospiraceae bacterium]
MEENELVIYRKTIPQRQAEYASFPEKLHPDIQAFLKQEGISQLYSHQAEMFEQAQEKKNIVITTSTASGKTLSFLLPVLQDILENPLTRAIFIYPTKALASDQYKALKPYLEYFGAGRLEAGVYDGDTPVSERGRIRKSANIILTNPEMINSAFLPNHSNFGFDFIFTNLKYIVIDEMHTYRGAFGSHLANVFRRVKRVCGYYHADPQFLCSSATIANPVELAENICGKEFVQVSLDGSPAAEREYLLLQPPAIKGKDGKEYGRTSTTTVAARLIPKLVENQVHFLAFARSRRNVEVVLKETRDRLDLPDSINLADKIAGYRGGYKASERKEIERKMNAGELLGLISTNALELGIDIGKLDATVLIGYPGTRASFWQQTGRAGRSNRKSVSYLILENNPFDQYIAIDPDWLFHNKSENAIIDQNNLLIELSHIRAAAAEMPLTLDDIALFPDLGEILPVLLSECEVESENGKFLWSGNAFPAGDFSLRNIDQTRYQLLEKETGRTITEMDESQCFHEIYPGAVYMHEGTAFEVLTLNLETRMAEAVPFEGNYYTVPSGQQTTRILQQFKDREYERSHFSFGDINVNEVVTMFKKLQFHNHENLGYVELGNPLSQNYDTESTWILIPEDVVDVYRSMLQRNQSGTMVRNDHFDGICNAIKNAAMMVTMTALDDIDVIVSNNALIPNTESSAEEQQVYIFIYDKYVGGLGYSEKIYDLMPEILENAIRMVGGCPCEDGCPACVGDYTLDKNMVLWGLKSLLAEYAPPNNVKVCKTIPKPILKKEFSFWKLGTQWQDFCKAVIKDGEGGYGKNYSFFQAVTGVKVEDNLLILTVDHAFYQDWIMEPANKESLLNIIKYHTEHPGNMDLSVSIAEPEDQENINGKNYAFRKRNREIK